MRALFIAAAVCFAGAAQAQQAAVFPAGPGREIVSVACVQCHTPGPFIQLRMSEQGWRRQVENMVLRGAQIGPSDLDQVSAYLAAHFGPGVPFPNQPKPQVSLADGPGENLVEGGCAICHGLDRVVATPRPGQQWQAIVHRMVEIGAPLDADQTNEIVAYLQAHYSSVK
jgi:mono/diheme cytochrome c family protein